MRSDLPHRIAELLTAAVSEALPVQRRSPPIVIAGSGNAVVQLTNKAHAASVVHIVGNLGSRYFGVKTV
jgi:hypothetical protein